MPSRRDDVAAYFAANATRLERTVARHVNASAPTVEDACATAWCVLVRRADIRLDAQGFWWLYRVAVHEAWKLTGEERRAPSVDVDELAECLSSSVEVTEHAEQRQTLRLLRELPERQARILVLRAYGFTYAEIARMTGATLRTIDRQLRRAR
jgi:RNA polymerase sigma factor (sigma-70 family)